MSDKIAKKRKRYIVRFTLLAVMVGLVVTALVLNYQRKNSELVDEGTTAPNFELAGLNTEQETIKLSDYEGQGVMLNFWATYCPPCKEEMPYMEEVYPEYKEKGVEILAVSVDRSELIVNQFMDKYDLSFPILHDKSEQVLTTYGIQPLPTTLFISPDGTVQRKVMGGLDIDRIKMYLDEIVPEA
ncbi:thiol-disulfide oxidoreductase [Pontibacillus halophilus JSM 076056 = DSM 19796]|uniref:Thiol-disulfide oxidoreductase n=1 Tax=Pontibacillus halophilus JSM 076056 = DSM 19796 TaxID=1385510 RepID=A0A0A5GG30_9BACI|nr:thiol-disulfide oxidoreductase ResA [Pontibacillus halophilus]KGX92206.1 thiol-disulfide oxidoreductase [Pontibacillus halophilus JSM 076056 = DSM 19796]